MNSQERNWFRRTRFPLSIPKRFSAKKYSKWNRHSYIHFSTAKIESLSNYDDDHNDDDHNDDFK